jgi:hypothetical protein
MPSTTRPKVSEGVHDIGLISCLLSYLNCRGSIRPVDGETASIPVPLDIWDLGISLPPKAVTSSMVLVLRVSKGIVRLTNHELADYDRSRLSRCELTPFRECRSAVLFEGIAHRRRLRMSPARLKPICSDNACGWGFRYTQGCINCREIRFALITINDHTARSCASLMPHRSAWSWT